MCCIEDENRIRLVARASLKDGWYRHDRGWPALARVERSLNRGGERSWMPIGRPPDNRDSPSDRGSQLIGTWQLESYRSVSDDGHTGEGPLGAAPHGLMIYGADCHMSVSMMRTDHAPARGDDPVTRFMGYAGRWHLAGEQVVHEVVVSSHSYLVGTRQVRDLTLDGDLLTLSAMTPIGAGPPQRRVLSWRRAGGGTL